MSKLMGDRSWVLRSQVTEEKHYLVAGGICEEVVCECGTGICSCSGLAMLAAFWVVSDHLVDIFLLNV